MTQKLLLFKYISILSSGGYFVQQNETNCKNLVEGNLRNISSKLVLI